MRTEDVHAATPAHPDPPDGVVEVVEGAEELLDETGGVLEVLGVLEVGEEPVEVPILLRILSHLLSG